MQRRGTRTINVGRVGIGSQFPISIQSMTNTKTSDISATLKQINELSSVGCEIIRIAVPDIQSAIAVSSIVPNSPIPVIADIHFDHKLALLSIKNGIHGIRINPGNIGSADKVKAVADAAGSAGISIRVGANSGSIAKEYKSKNISGTLQSKQEVVSNSLVESALYQCSLLEDYGFKNIKVSLKASDVITMIKAYEKFAKKTDYPLHLGVTEAGTLFQSTVKSSIGIGSLLVNGIGDTIRVSVTGDCRDEIKIARSILESLSIRHAVPEIISCPTCARTSTDLINLTDKIEIAISELKSTGVELNPFKLAIMGCAVNGPGEARDADIGIAGATGQYVLFEKEKTIAAYKEDEIIDVLLKYVVEKYGNSKNK